MASVRVRYVLTGACLPAYSGRVVHAIVPMSQPDGTPTTVACLIQQFRTNWPAEMKELAEAIADVPIKVLKTGRVLNDDDVVESLLSASEKETCRVAAGETVGEHAEELQKPSVVMHMVIQKSRAPVEDKAKKERAKSSTTSDGGNSGEGREAKKNSCCCVM